MDEQGKAKESLTQTTRAIKTKFSESLLLPSNRIINESRLVINELIVTLSALISNQINNANYVVHTFQF